MTDVFQSNGLTLAAFDPASLGILALPDPNGTVLPIAPGEVLHYAPNADAALDGPMFDTCGGADYASAECDVPLFLQYDTQRNVSLPGQRPGVGVLIAVVNGAAMASRTIQVPDGASVAVQLYPALVDRGNPVSPSDSTAEQRAALALLDDGRLAFAIGAMSMPAFAQALIDAGAIYAGYTDGGGSTHLVTPDRVRGASEQRRVASWLVAEGGGGATTTDVGIGLVLLAIAGGMFYLLVKK